MTMIKFRASSGYKLISETAFDLLAREVFTLLKEKAPKVHRHDADSIDDSSTKKIPLITKQDEWDRKIDEQRLQQEIQKLSSGLSWKGVYATLTELRATIQSPKEGDFVIVTQEPTYGNKNTILIYEAESTNDWQEIGDLFLPGIATGSQSGLMSSQDKTKLDNISTDKLLTPEDKQKWNEASDKSKQNETSLNNKVDKTTNINVGDGLQGGGDLTTNRTINIMLNGDSLSVDSQGLKANVVNNLDSDSTTQSLSALQGKSLKTMVDAKVGKTTQIIAGNGLQGTGALSGNVTISLKPEDDSIQVSDRGVKVSIVDGLTDTSTAKSLSANQGKVLNEKIDGVVTIVQNHTQELANKMSEEEARQIIDRYKNA